MKTVKVGLIVIGTVGISYIGYKIVKLVRTANERFETSINNCCETFKTSLEEKVTELQSTPELFK